MSDFVATNSAANQKNWPVAKSDPRATPEAENKTKAGDKAIHHQALAKADPLGTGRFERTPGRPAQPNFAGADMRLGQKRTGVGVVVGAQGQQKIDSTTVKTIELLDAAMREVLFAVSGAEFVQETKHGKSRAKLVGKNPKAESFVRNSLKRLGLAKPPTDNGPTADFRQRLLPAILDSMRNHIGHEKYNQLKPLQRALLARRPLAALPKALTKLTVDELIKKTVSDKDVALIQHLDFTYQQEIGAVGTRNDSTVLHRPSDTSGVTIGPGLDMKLRSKAQVKTILINAGVSQAIAAKMAEGAGLTGEAAKKFVKDNKDLKITDEQQKKIFLLLVPKYIAGAKNFVDAKHGAGTWDKLSPKQQAMLVDMHYNPGLSLFPKFTAAVVTGNQGSAREEYLRYKKVEKKDKEPEWEPLDKRNTDFYDKYLKDDWPAS